jgi:hypothetical protein
MCVVSPVVLYCFKTLIFHINGRTNIDADRKQGVQENIWILKGLGNRACNRHWRGKKRIDTSTGETTLASGRLLLKRILSEIFPWGEGLDSSGLGY